MNNLITFSDFNPVHQVGSPGTDAARGRDCIAYLSKKTLAFQIEAAYNKCDGGIMPLKVLLFGSNAEHLIRNVFESVFIDCFFDGVFTVEETMVKLNETSFDAIVVPYKEFPWPVLESITGNYPQLVKIMLTGMFHIERDKYELILKWIDYFLIKQWDHVADEMQRVFIEIGQHDQSNEFKKRRFEQLQKTVKRLVL